MQKNNRIARDLTQGCVMPVLLRFSYPVMIANLLQTAYNMVDMIIVGRFVGSTGLCDRRRERAGVRRVLRAGVPAHFKRLLCHCERGRLSALKNPFAAPLTGAAFCDTMHNRCCATRVT